MGRVHLAAIPDQTQAPAPSTCALPWPAQPFRGLALSSSPGDSGPASRASKHLPAGVIPPRSPSVSPSPFPHAWPGLWTGKGAWGLLLREGASAPTLPSHCAPATRPLSALPSCRARAPCSRDLCTCRLCGWNALLPGSHVALPLLFRFYLVGEAFPAHLPPGAPGPLHLPGSASLLQVALAVI